MVVLTDGTVEHAAERTRQCRLEAHAVADRLAERFTALVGDALGDTHCADATWLQSNSNTTINNSSITYLYVLVQWLVIVCLRICKAYKSAYCMATGRT